MRTWLSNCVTNHSKCKQIPSRGCPKRVLDLRAFAGSNDIRLIEWQSVPTSSQYVTLSHCWGPVNNHPICTTKADLDDRKLRIAFEKLSLTFQDAVKICRDLDQRYLWIDSLCIIQDDGEDWLDQASAMASIYGGSFVTLAALSSADSTQGCWTRPREAGRTELSRYQDFDFDSQRVRVFERWPAYWHSEYGDNPYKDHGYGSNPLRTRAWTLQERELSLRCINFAQGQLLWQCRTMKGSSQLPWHEMRPDHDDFCPLPLYLNQEEELTSDGPAFQRGYWYDLVEDYSSRNLTKETDKLPALAGLASRFLEQNSPGRYLAGIWSDHLPSALLWRIVNSYERTLDPPSFQPTSHLPRLPQLHRAPSWSWASIDGEISYESQRIDTSDNARLPSDSDYGNFAITGFDFQSVASSDLFSPPSDATLQVRGSITELQVSTQPIKRQPCSSMLPLLSTDDTTVGAFYPDILEDFRFVRSLHVLSIRSEPYFSFVQMPFSLYEHYGAEPLSYLDLRMGLALLRMSSNEAYRPVGLVRWLRKEVFDDLLAVQLTIV